MYLKEKDETIAPTKSVSIPIDNETPMSLPSDGKANIQATEAAKPAQSTHEIMRPVETVC